MPMDGQPGDPVNHGEDLKLKIQEMKDILEDAGKLEKGPDMFGDMVQEFLRIPQLMKNVLDDAKAVSEEEPKVDQSNDDKVQDKKKDAQKVEDRKEAPGTEEGALLEVDDETPEDKQEGQPEDEDAPLGDLDFPIAMEEKTLEHEFEVDFN